MILNRRLLYNMIISSLQKYNFHLNVLSLNVQFYTQYHEFHFLYTSNKKVSMKQVQVLSVSRGKDNCKCLVGRSIGLSHPWKHCHEVSFLTYFSMVTFILHTLKLHTLILLLPISSSLYVNPPFAYLFLLPNYFKSVYIYSCNP